MPSYKTYNKLYFKGKPTGKAFIYHKALKAKNKKAAKAKIDKINARWNRLERNSKYTVKTVKVVRK